MKFLEQYRGQYISMGPFLNPADGKTPITDISCVVMMVRKQNGTFAATASTSACSHDNAGYMSVAVASVDLDTIGHIRFAVTNPSSHLPVWEDYMVLTPSAYAAIVGSGTWIGMNSMQSDVTDILDFHKGEHHINVTSNTMSVTRRDGTSSLWIFNLTTTNSPVLPYITRSPV